MACAHARKIQSEKYSWLSITRTFANSNQNRLPLDFLYIFTVILLACYRLEVVGTRKNGRTRGRHARDVSRVSFSRARFFLCPLLPSACYAGYNFTLDNSNLPLTRSNFCFPLDHFHIILPSITPTMFWALKKSGKKQCTVFRNVDFEFPIDVL